MFEEGLPAINRRTFETPPAKLQPSGRSNLPPYASHRTEEGISETIRRTKTPHVGNANANEGPRGQPCGILNFPRRPGVVRYLFHPRMSA